MVNRRKLSKLPGQVEAPTRHASRLDLGKGSECAAMRMVAEGGTRDRTTNAKAVNVVSSELFWGKDQNILLSCLQLGRPITSRESILISESKR